MRPFNLKYKLLYTRNKCDSANCRLSYSGFTTFRLIFLIPDYYYTFFYNMYEANAYMNANSWALGLLAISIERQFAT